MRSAVKKWRDSAGFTLGEMLLAVMILLMVSIIVATGIPAAKNAYERVVLASNAEMLLSTTISTLRSELSAVGELKVASGTDIVYYNKTNDARSRIWVDQSDADSGPNAIKYQRFYSSSNDVLATMEPSAEVDLLPPDTSTPDLYVTYRTVSYSNHVLTFEDLSVNRRSGAKGLASRDKFCIWVLEY